MGNLNGTIIEDSTNVNADDSRLFYFKIISENFSVFIDNVTNLGHVLNINIVTEDVSKDISNSKDRIDHLNKRLHEAKKQKDAKLIDELQAKITETKSNITIIYFVLNFSYI